MAVSETFTYTLPSGATIEVENLPETRRGARDVAAPDGQERDIPFENVISPLGEVCQLIFEKIRSTVTAPDNVQIELSASLKGKTSFVLVSGETQGTLKVTLSWKKNTDAS
jgi:hypothetical protein